MSRLRLPLTVYALVLVIGTALAALLAAGARAGEHDPIERVDAIGITVADLDRALAFYTGVLPFAVVSEAEVAGEAFEHLFGVFGLRARIARLRLGAEEIELIDYLAPEGRPIPVDSRSNDFWFQHFAIIVSDMDEAYAQLRRHKVQHASSGPQTLPDWNPNAGGIKAFYFKDPDGNHLEILQFPAGKGDPRWHEPADALFLGIDHTAIVVDDTDRSLAFYRDRLGIDVASAIAPIVRPTSTNCPSATVSAVTVPVAGAPISVVTLVLSTSSSSEPASTRSPSWTCSLTTRT
jgi:catechol 2,3-dioxygenase-like lactoylglutathione lyase family enzyme